MSASKKKRERRTVTSAALLIYADPFVLSLFESFIQLWDYARTSAEVISCRSSGNAIGSHD